jgi:dolichol kinase
MDRMNENLKYYLLYAIAYGLILLLGEAIYRFLKKGSAWSRSFAHLSPGLITLPFPWLFSSHWWVLALALQSSLILWISRRMNFLPSHHRIAGKSAGSFLFFASIYLCFLASNYTGRKELFVVPMLVLSFSDVAAALVGRSYGKRNIQKRGPADGHHKTIAGSTAFFISALVVLFLSFYYYMQWDLAIAIPMALIVALLSASVEAYCPHGTDNFFVPFTVLIIMQLNFLL